MKRVIVAVLASLALAGCQTMPEWAEGLRSPAASSTTATTTAASPAYASGPARVSGEQQLLDLERRLAANAQIQGLAAALAPALDPVDGFVIRPGVLYQGQDNVPAALGTAATEGPVFWQADRVFMSDDNTMGVTSGRYVQVVVGAEAIQGRYLVVWRKDSGGEWRALTETRIPDPQRAPPSTRRR